MAEATIAVDPAKPDRMAAGADPYRNPVRITVVTSGDGGRSWGDPVELLPPGFAKSYDPSLAYEPDGSILVVGGASQSGRARCQPGSAIFGARIKASGLSYFLIQPPRADTYFDRPRMVRRNGAGGRVFVTWTESSGRGAECRGSPLGRSTTYFTRSTGPTNFEPPRSLPSSGLPAPFGSSIALGDRGRVWIAVGDRDPGRVERAVVVWSRDDGRTLSGPEIVGEGPAVPGSIPGLGGYVTAVPSIAAIGLSEPVVAWAAQKAGGPRVEVAVRRGGSWSKISPPTLNPALFPAITYDGSGKLRLLYLSYARRRADFFLTTLGGNGWDPPTLVASGDAAGYLEVGQFLGLASGRATVGAAVPVQRPQSSELVVSTLRVALPTPTPSAQVTPSTRDGGQGDNRGGGFSTAALAIIGAGAVGLGMARWRRR